ncbi:MAG: LysR family transcriptional regulator [Oceanospirillaceae bacterium]|nr:LysR family transcriptional regulator [Oceanospirillaceae bacterium]|tara:strand:+ start:534 stop:1412 length:879 start_codon:yes stop_codon:yes gene_type:complete
MDKFRAMQLFVRLADVGSFTRVADQMSVSKSMISKEVRRLEDGLGVRLLHRTTRGVQLTHAGEGYLQRAREILLQMEEAENFAEQLQRQPKGKLRVNAPMALGIIELSGMFSDFMQTYPDIELDIHLGDESVDLVEGGFDLGFRASSRPFDSSYVGKPVTEFTYHVCASPQYLAQHPDVTRAADLRQHNCFVYSYFQGKNIWPVDEGVTVQGTLKVNSVVFMLEVIKNGLGIGLIPDFICREALDSGSVVEVLPNSHKPQLTLYALYPARHFVPPKTVQCIQYMENWFDDQT